MNAKQWYQRSTWGNRYSLSIYGGKCAAKLFVWFNKISLASPIIIKWSWLPNQSSSRNRATMVAVAHLSRFRVTIFYRIITFHKYAARPALPITPKLFSTFIPKPSRAQALPTSPLPKALVEDEDEDEDDEPHVEIPIDKLYIPPDTEVSFDSSNSSTRILKGSNIVLSKYARDARINDAEFVKSSVRTEDCPSDERPEFALVGRSNVGKSSLLNSLVRRKNLALISKKPGKTQCINHFRINDSWYLVDLPGYGYASAPKELRKDWGNFTKDYFLNRSTLVSVFLLIDASIPAKQIDIDYASWLGQNQVPMTLVFTKCDKRKKKKNGGKRPEENVHDFQELIRQYFQAAPPWIMTSSVTNQGRDEVLLHMAQLRNYWLKH